MKRNLVIASGIVTAALITALIIRITSKPDWGLHIVVFSVGQADAIAMVSSDGSACVIDAGYGSISGKKVATFLKDKDLNGVTAITKVKLGFATHYDVDHIGGFDTVIDEGISFQSMYDQGVSKKRKGKPVYKDYVSVTGDLNDNMVQDEDEDFIRKKARVGLHWKLGEARIKCLGARGDTKGSDFDIDLDPSENEIDENPGSVALLVTLGDFEFYTAGDQTCDDWKGKPDTEIAIVNSGVIGDDTDIDVLKVNHHGSDTSTGYEFVNALDPEVAIISSEYTDDQLPKMISIKQLVENNTLVYVTGDGFNPDTGTFTDSGVTEEDDGFLFPDSMVVNNAGDVHIFVASDGNSYKVVTDSVWMEFSSIDSENPH